MTMSDVKGQVLEVVNNMNELVARDGGSIVVLSVDDATHSVDVRYQVGVNDECATCLITPEMLHDFLIEGFKAHELGVESVRVLSD